MIEHAAGASRSGPSINLCTFCVLDLSWLCHVVPLETEETNRTRLLWVALAFFAPLETFPNSESCPGQLFCPVKESPLLETWCDISQRSCGKKRKRSRLHWVCVSKRIKGWFKENADIEFGFTWKRYARFARLESAWVKLDLWVAMWSKLGRNLQRVVTADLLKNWYAESQKKSVFGKQIKLAYNNSPGPFFHLVMMVMALFTSIPLFSHEWSM